jgi:alpha-1,6-mannosyltransferase
MLESRGAVAVVDRAPRRLRVVDVALFYGERSGGIRTYLEAKARFAARTGAFEHHLVVPGRTTSSDGRGRHQQRSLRLAASNPDSHSAAPACRSRCGP